MAVTYLLRTCASSLLTRPHRQPCPRFRQTLHAARRRLLPTYCATRDRCACSYIFERAALEQHIASCRRSGKVQRGTNKAMHPVAGVNTYISMEDVRPSARVKAEQRRARLTQLTQAGTQQPGGGATQAGPSADDEIVIDA